MLFAKSSSPSGTRTRVFRVKAEYPNRLDYKGRTGTLCWLSSHNPPVPWSSEHAHELPHLCPRLREFPWHPTAFSQSIFFFFNLINKWLVKSTRCAPLQNVLVCNSLDGRVVDTDAVILTFSISLLNHLDSGQGIRKRNAFS